MKVGGESYVLLILTDERYVFHVTKFIFDFRYTDLIQNTLSIPLVVVNSRSIYGKSA